MLHSFLFLHAVAIAFAITVLAEFIICNLFFSVIKDEQVISVHLKNNENINIPKLFSVVSNNEHPVIPKN